MNTKSSDKVMINLRKESKAVSKNSKTSAALDPDKNKFADYGDKVEEDVKHMCCGSGGFSSLAIHQISEATLSGRDQEMRNNEEKCKVVEVGQSSRGGLL